MQNTIISLYLVHKRNHKQFHDMYILMIHYQLWFGWLWFLIKGNAKVLAQQWALLQVLFFLVFLFPLTHPLEYVVEVAFGITRSSHMSHIFWRYTQYSATQVNKGRIWLKSTTSLSSSYHALYISLTNYAHIGNGSKVDCNMYNRQRELALNNNKFCMNKMISTNGNKDTRTFMHM